MKKIFLVLLIFYGAYEAQAQTETNKFPPNGNVGVGTVWPQSYFHGGNNKVLEIFNPNTSTHSQSHLILSTGATIGQSSAGSITWLSKNSTGNKGMAYIGVQSIGDNVENASGKIFFATADADVPVSRMVIDNKGMVGIGTLSPTEKLSVNGNIRAKEIKVEAANWPDYVFEEQYALMPLNEIKKYIAENKHLPEMPAAAAVEKEGVNLGQVQALLLKKIEELTLHLIKQEEIIKAQGKQIDLLLNKPGK